ncbi:hypothetical protein [Caulobacter segnis]
MTVLNGTPGDDKLFADLHGSDYVISAGAGNDQLVLTGGDYWNLVGASVDLGQGDDKVSVNVASTLPVVIHGGDGKDTFELISGGIAYGDGGEDVFVAMSRGQSYRDDVPIIADFNAGDQINVMSYLLTNTSWRYASNPFESGYLRLVQVGADAFLLGKSALGWEALLRLQNVNAAAMVEANFGFQPHVTALPEVTLTATAPLYEGSWSPIQANLKEALSYDLNVVIEGKPTSFAGDHLGTYTVTIPAGQKTATFYVGLDEDASPTPIQYSYWVRPGEAAPVASGGVLTVTPTDNDTASFSISWTNGLKVYETLTQLTLNPIMPMAQILEQLPGPGFNSERWIVRGLSASASQTTSVALTSYQFFTGKTPSQAGLKYLVNSSDNPSDLNDLGGIYAGMNFANRYINFAANLGLVGEGKATFATAYQGLSFADAVAKAYDAIIGVDYAKAKGVDVAAALSGVVAAKAYFDGLAAQRMGGFDQDLAAKAGMVGYLISEGIKANVGIYARSVENFYLDYADGSAQHHVDLIGVYGPGTFVDAFGNNPKGYPS